MTQPADDRNGTPPSGVYPAMLTAFHDDGAIDFSGVDRLIDFCIDAGCAGLFVCGLSAEILWMEDEERTNLVAHIVQRVDGRVPVVAGAIRGGSPQEQAELVRRIHETGADLVSVSVCQFADESESDSVWIRRAEALLESIPEDTCLAFYECPLPYWRLLSEKTLAWAVGTGRFTFLKDTCCDIERIRARLGAVAKSPLQLYNANSETLLASLQAGAYGFCGIGANYFPELYVWLCNHFNDEPELARDLQHFLDTCFGLTEGECYPLTAKAFVKSQGLDIGLYCRKQPPAMSPEMVKGLEEMRISANQWRDRLTT